MDVRDRDTAGGLLQAFCPCTLMVTETVFLNMFELLQSIWLCSFYRFEQVAPLFQQFWDQNPYHVNIKAKCGGTATSAWNGNWEMVTYVCMRVVLLFYYYCHLCCGWFLPLAQSFRIDSDTFFCLKWDRENEITLNSLWLHIDFTCLLF